MYVLWNALFNILFQNSWCLRTKIFVFVLGSEDWKWFILLNNTLSLLSFYRNEIFVNGECVYSVTAYNQEYLAKYHDLIIQETSLEAHIRDVITRFVRTDSVDKGESPGRLSLLEEVDDLRDFLSTQEFLLQHEIEQCIQSIDERMLQKIFEIKRKGTCALNKMVNIFNIYYNV